jgi:hypothetical protein
MPGPALVSEVCQTGQSRGDRCYKILFRLVLQEGDDVDKLPKLFQSTNPSVEAQGIPRIGTAHADVRATVSL